MSPVDPQGSPPPAPPARPASRPGLLRRAWGSKWARLFVVLALVLAAVSPLALGWLSYHFSNSITDDAFVETHIVNLGPQQVSGHIVRFLVQEHDAVSAG